MKRFLCMMLCLLTVAGLLACGNKAPAETTQAPEPTQSPEEEAVMKVLLIGNSHSNDAFWLLPEVFKAEAPDQKFMIGILYYSGCSLHQHESFAKSGERVYVYYRNSGEKWEAIEEASMQMGLRDQQWDLVAMQSAKGDYDGTMYKTGRDYLATVIAECVKEPYDLLWHSSWPSPNDETFYAPSYDPQPPSNFREFLTTKYNFDPVQHLTKMNEEVKVAILDDPMYSAAICCTTAISHATMAQGVPQTEIYRDYTHLSDYGRLIAAYAWYTQLTGAPVTEVKLDTVPANLRHRRAQVLGDLTVTEEMEKVIVEATTYTFQNPWTVPGQ